MSNWPLQWVIGFWHKTETDRHRLNTWFLTPERQIQKDSDIQKVKRKKRTDQQPQIWLYFPIIIYKRGKKVIKNKLLKKVKQMKVVFFPLMQHNCTRDQILLRTSFFSSVMGAEGSMVDREVVLLWKESDRSVSTAKLILRSTGLPTPPVTQTYTQACMADHTQSSHLHQHNQRNNGAGDDEDTQTHRHDWLNAQSNQRKSVTGDGKYCL